MSDLKKNPSTCKHLTFEDRVEIQECLFHGVSFKAIARRIGKAPHDHLQGSQEAHSGHSRENRESSALPRSVESALRVQRMYPQKVL